MQNTCFRTVESVPPTFCASSVILVVQVFMFTPTLFSSCDPGRPHLEALQFHHRVFEDHLETCLSNNAPMCGWFEPTLLPSGNVHSHWSPYISENGLDFCSSRFVHHVCTDIFRRVHFSNAPLCLDFSLSVFLFFNLFSGITDKQKQ